MPPYSLRESWLQAAVELVRPLFAAKQHVIPQCRVSVGFASSGVRSSHIGQCWSTGSSLDGINQIFVSPALGDPFAVIDTLVHELVHAVDDCEHRHGKEFRKIALSLGMKGPMRSAGAGPELKAKLEQLLTQLGPYPHGKLNAPPKKVVSRERPRAKCAKCGYQVPMLRKFVSYGPPICPKDRIEMEQVGDWAQD